MSETCKTTAEQIEAKLAEPKQVSGDQGSVTNHSISDLIAADKHVASKDAITSKRRLFNGIFGARYLPPSARGS